MDLDLDLGISAAGLLVGFVVGLTGMGGGALMTPILVLGFGIDPLKAVSSDLVASVIMKPVGGGVHLRKGTVNLGMVKWLMLGSVPAAFLSVVALDRYSETTDVDHVIEFAIGVALLLASAALVAKGAFRHRGGDEDVEHVAPRPLPTLAIGVFGGVMVGLTSVGSGSLMMVLMLVVYPRLSARQLVGTDLVQAVPLVGAAAVAHLLFGEVQLEVTGSLLLGALPGVYVGAHVSSRSPDHAIRPILAVLLGITGLTMLGVPEGVVASVGVVAAAGAVFAIVTGGRRAAEHAALAVIDHDVGDALLADDAAIEMLDDPAP